MNEVEKVYGMAIWFIKTLCIETNATEAKYTVSGFNNKITGEKYGDWEIIVRKKPQNTGIQKGDFQKWLKQLNQ